MLEVVTDTNVILDVLSTHDLTTAATLVAQGSAVSRLAFRQQRARASLLFVMCLDQTGATSYTDAEEWLRVMQMRVLPPTRGSAVTTSDASFIDFSLTFVKERILPGWRMESFLTPDGEHGSQIDQRYVDFAKYRNLPLVTNEEGIRSQDIRGRAAKAGVKVYTPYEFYTNNVGAVDLQSLFFKRFDEELPIYYDREHRFVSDGKLYSRFAYFRRLYHYIFTGSSPGMPEPIMIGTSNTGGYI